MTLEQLTQAILDTHHRYLHEHMPSLDRALVEAHAPIELMRPWRDLLYTMGDHMQKEEVILFPALKALSRGEPELWVEGPMAAMEMAHMDIRDIEAALRSVADLAGPNRAHLIELLDDLSEHARIEDEELFAGARQTIGEMSTGRKAYAL